jgi:hypothetical protein
LLVGGCWLVVIGYWLGRDSLLVIGWLQRTNNKEQSTNNNQQSTINQQPTTNNND